MTENKNLGALASLHRYPVKSMMGEELNTTRIHTKGLFGDRIFALSDPETGKIASAKNPSKWPTLFQFHATYTQPLTDSSCGFPPVRITFPDGSAALSGDTDLDHRLSDALGKPVHFLSGAPRSGTLEEYWPTVEGLAKQDVVTDEAMPTETFFDCASVHLLTTGTLDSLRMLYPQGRFETRRFRPNIVIETPPGSEEFPEGQWEGKTIALGDEVRLKITGPCGRCVMTTLAQSDLPNDTGILRAAAKYNKAHVGVYASVIQGGVVRRGDPVWIVPE
jgi:uncharacterized protein YcbX